MLKRLRAAGLALFPVERLGTPAQFAKRMLDSEERKKRLTALQAAAEAATEARLKEFRDIARARLADEGSRQISIMTRAQGLFVALALFGALFTIGSSFLAQSSHIGRALLWLCAIVAAYILAQIVIMVVHILNAIGGIPYSHAGNSEFTHWLRTRSDAEFYRAEGLIALDHYRAAVLNNDWRFSHLEQAFKGLRNIVYAVSALILLLFVGALIAKPAAGAAIECVQGDHWWCS